MWVFSENFSVYFLTEICLCFLYVLISTTCCVFQGWMGNMCCCLRSFEPGLIIRMNKATLQGHTRARSVCVGCVCVCVCVCRHICLLYVLLLVLSHFSCVRLCATSWTAADQAPPSLGFSRQEHWSGLPFPSPDVWNYVCCC